MNAQRVWQVAIGITVAGLVMLLAHVDDGLRGVETASLDLRFRLRGVKPPGAETVLVLVDDASLATFGRWPFSRHIFAMAIDRLRSAGAKVIAFDILFAEPEVSIPAELRSAASGKTGSLSAEQRQALSAALDDLGTDAPDVELAHSMRAASNVLLPIALTFAGAHKEDLPDFAEDASYLKLARSPYAPVFPLRPVAPLVPIPVLAKAAAGFGHVDIAYDSDGKPRYDYLALPLGVDFIASLPVRVAAAYLDVPWSQVSVALGAGVTVGPIDIPTDRAMRLLVNYHGPRGTYPIFSLADLMAGRVPPDAFRGRIVLIGASFLGNSDSNSSPFGSTLLSGTERMANIIDTILHRDWIRTDITSTSLVILVAVVLIAGLSSAIASWLPTQAALAASAVPIVVWCGAAQVAFIHDVWLPVAWPIVALFAAIGTTLIYRYWVVDRQGRYIMSAFQHYLAPDFVKILAGEPDRLNLGGETRNITILFSDIRGFTSIAEQFKKNPLELSRLINRGFLSPMTDLIMNRQGTIDKYMGDCIMAFWNAPLDVSEHADKACAAALAMIAETARINELLMSEAKEAGRNFTPINIGVGVNTGECIVGNMGSNHRFSYTALGDAVNLASRLEGQSKTYSIDIVIGEDTRKLAKSWAAIELDLIEVKGKEDAARIYGLLGDAELAQSQEFQRLLARHEAMLSCYRRQDWLGARAALRRCRLYGPPLQAFYDLYEERIDFYEANPPGPSWDGVFVALHK